MPFTVHIGSDLWGAKHNFILPFLRAPSMAEMVESAQWLFDVKCRGCRPAGYPDVAFTIESIQFLREGVEWVPAGTALPISEMQQFWCFQPESIWHSDAPGVMPPPIPMPFFWTAPHDTQRSNPTVRFLDTQAPPTFTEKVMTVFYDLDTQKAGYVSADAVFERLRLSGVTLAIPPSIRDFLKKADPGIDQTMTFPQWSVVAETYPLMVDAMFFRMMDEKHTPGSPSAAPPVYVEYQTSHSPPVVIERPVIVERVVDRPIIIEQQSMPQPEPSPPQVVYVQQEVPRIPPPISPVAPEASVLPVAVEVDMLPEREREVVEVLPELRAVTPVSPPMQTQLNSYATVNTQRSQHTPELMPVRKQSTVQSAVQSVAQSSNPKSASNRSERSERSDRATPVSHTSTPLRPASSANLSVASSGPGATVVSDTEPKHPTTTSSEESAKGVMGGGGDVVVQQGMSPLEAYLIMKANMHHANSEKLERMLDHVPSRGPPARPLTKAELMTASAMYPPAAPMQSPTLRVPAGNPNALAGAPPLVQHPPPSPTPIASMSRPHGYSHG